MILDLAATLLIPLLAGVGLLSAMGLVARSDRLAHLGWAWVGGALLTAGLTFLWLAASLPLERVGALRVVVCLVGVVLWRLGRGRLVVALHPAPPAPPPWEAWIFRAVVALVLAATVLRILEGDLAPLHKGDEAEFWALKAKVIFHSGGFNGAFREAMSNPHFVYHKDYPLLNPLLQVWTFANLGEITHFANRLPIQAFALAFVLVLASALRRLVRPAIAAGILFCVVALPETGFQAKTAHADLMVALGAAMGLDAWLRWRTHGLRPWWRLFCLSLALMVWSKNEGLLYLGAIAGSVGLALVLGRRGIRDVLPPARVLAGMCLPVGILALTWSFNAWYGFENDILIGDTRESTFPALVWTQLPTHLPRILAYFGREILANPLHSNLLLAAFLGMLAAFPRRCLGGEVGALARALLLVLGGYVLVFTGTPHELDWHLPSAAQRVSYQIVPAVALWIALAAGRLAPERLGPEARRFPVRSATLLAATILSLFAGECAIRWIDPYGISDSFDGERYRNELVELAPDSPRLFRHRPSHEIECRRYTIRTDSRGLRGPERRTPKPPDTRRILFLGDSVVFGWGVAEEDTFVARVGAELEARTGRDWEAINAGHLLHDTTQELGVLEEVGLSYEPDVLVLVFVDNDVVLTREVFALAQRDLRTDERASDEAKRVLRNMERLARLRPFLPYTHALLSFLYIRSHPAGHQGSQEHAVELGIDLETGWTEARAALRRMAEIAEGSAVPFAILDYYAWDELRTFCAAEGIPYASIAFTEEELATGIRNSEADAHANPRGHRYLTAHVLDALETLGLLEAAR